jgi:hypothetical protein
MPRRLALAERLRIKSPCDASWSTMQESEAGGAQRFCTKCDRHVHDASKLTRREVESLLRARKDGERMCFHLHVRRDDGAILLADGHAMPGKGAVRASLAVIAAASALAACASPQQQQQPAATPHGVVEIPDQPAPPPTPTSLWPEPAPEPMRAAEPPRAMVTAEPPLPPPEEPPPPPLPPPDPPKTAKPVKGAAPAKAVPAHPPPKPKRPPIYDHWDGGI